MSAGKHTPGPWTLDDVERVGYQVNGPIGRGVAFAYQRDEHPAIGQGISHAEALANARLIAAAPDLLEALRAFTDPFDSVEVIPNGDVAKARAAIDKATGEQA